LITLETENEEIYKNASFPLIPRKQSTTLMKEILIYMRIQYGCRSDRCTGLVLPIYGWILYLPEKNNWYNIY